MFDLVTRLNEECGVRLPEKDDQDWEFCAGDYTRTEDYIEFYKKDLLKRTCVNINDLNDLYKTIVTKELNLEKGPVLNKVK